MTKQAKLKCRHIRPVSERTLRGEGCQRLWDRMGCFSGGKRAKPGEQGIPPKGPLTDEQKKMRVPIEPCGNNQKPGEPGCDELGYTFTRVIQELHRRPCPTVSPNKLIEMLRQVLPHRRFRRWRNTVQLPKSITKKEIAIITQFLGDTVCNNKGQVLRHNIRLRKYYISPATSKEVATCHD